MALKRTHLNFPEIDLRGASANKGAVGLFRSWVVLIAAGAGGKLLAWQERESCRAGNVQCVSDYSGNPNAQNHLLDSSLGHLIIVGVCLIGQGANVANVLSSSTRQPDLAVLL